MKHVKKFENFRMNEETSFKYLLPIIASLFFNLKSASAFSGGAHASHSRGGGRGGGYISKVNVADDLSRIQGDLKNLKRFIDDPELVDLIEKVDDLYSSSNFGRSQHIIPEICDEIENLLKRDGLYDRQLSDSLNHLKSGNIEDLRRDYKILLDKYDDAKSSDTKASIYLIIGLVIVVILYSIHFISNQQGGRY